MTHGERLCNGLFGFCPVIARYAPERTHLSRMCFGVVFKGFCG